MTDGARAARAMARLARVLECSLATLTPSLSLAQYRVLAAVDDGGERATHLARGLALAKPTVTAAVDGLVERGLVTREPVLGDRRSLRIALTLAGRDVLTAAEAAMADQLVDVITGSGEKPAAILAILARLFPVPGGMRART